MVYYYTLLYAYNFYVLSVSVSVFIMKKTDWKTRKKEKMNLNFKYLLEVINNISVRLDVEMAANWISTGIWYDFDTLACKKYRIRVDHNWGWKLITNDTHGSQCVLAYAARNNFS